MSEDEEEPEVANFQEAFVFLNFRDQDGDDLQGFQGLNLPVPSEGEHIGLGEVTLTSEESTEEMDVEQTSSNAEVVSSKKQYFALFENTGEGKKQASRAPMIYADVELRIDEDEEEPEESGPDE
ncbi:hypothetical protein NKF06_19175 [Haloferax sp. AB510]|uniref:hypothetical protein n=1 Tax=Haloferax sp. AB510 TaxID=2934172 RepID=UPI00209C5E97|nr:hypothetical protein [Haloferax sp. AB510]MCO8268643.1 hypothetical protein [Haloferax sp. AB510]